MAYRKIEPINAGSMKKPSLYRACVRGDKAEYWACEMKIMQLYKKANENG